MDKYTKFVLTVLAINTTLLAIDVVATRFIEDASAQTPVYVEGGHLSVEITGGRLDYETDITSGPTLKVCTQC